MTRLSACYFCGIAMDEPLADYPIVPSGLRGDDDTRTVTLCPSCHQKLDAIMDVVSEAVADAEDLDFDDALGDDPVGASTAAGGDADVQDSDEPASSPETAETSEPSDPDDDSTDASAEEPADSGDETAAGDTTDAETPDAHDGTTDADDVTTETDDGGDEAADAAERSVVEGEHSISALEYNRVMRLLQNREFPVDREEIETVAANAYGLARSDCATVIDLAVDRGLIEEADGELHRPGDA